MALQTSGAISFSQIASHFGGSGSHSLSEYRALAGLGVSGIPSSGSISFSHFHGKSNQVTTSVWVPSGYNQSTSTYRGTYGGYFDWGIYWMYTPGTSQNVIYWKVTNYSRPTYIASTFHRSVGTASSYVYGSYRLVRGGQRSSSKRGTNNFHQFAVYQLGTTWVDTSSYQNQTTTARITT